MTLTNPATRFIEQRRVDKHVEAWRRFPRRRVQVIIEPRDLWVGYYRGDEHHYICLAPCVAIRWRRR